MCVGFCTWVQFIQRPEVSDSPAPGVMGGWEPQDMSAKNLTQVL